MNKNYTLKELADIGAKAAEDECSTMAVSRGHEDFGIDTQAREAFTKAILDAIGYEFPKDEERKAFERWQKSHTVDPNDAFFDVWKAGREELRRSINRPHYSADEQIKEADKLVSDAVKKAAVEAWSKTKPA